MNTITLRSLRASCPYRRIQPTSLSTRYKSLQPSSIASPVSHLFRAQTCSASTSTGIPAPSSPSVSKVNGPLSTLPASLSLPTREPSQAALLYYIYLGKAFATFYKTGVKNIYQNFKTSRTIQNTLNTSSSTSLYETALKGSLSRHDFQLLIRNWHDIKRVPIFALVFMICGEFTPLVVIALSNVVPWTCRIPKQILNDRKKLEERRAISFQNLTTELPKEKGNVVAGLERMQLLHISWSLGLSSRIWDWLGGKLPGLPTFLLRRKVERRVRYLEVDDFLINEWGGVSEMTGEEVKMACVERGIDILGKKEEGLKADLSAWLRSRERAGVERLLLTRPSVWPVRAKSL